MWAAHGLGSRVEDGTARAGSASDAGRRARDRSPSQRGGTLSATAQDGIVRTVIGGGLRDTTHPSYQAWSYAELLRDFNEAVGCEAVRRPFGR